MSHVGVESKERTLLPLTVSEACSNAALAVLVTLGAGCGSTPEPDTTSPEDTVSESPPSPESSPAKTPTSEKPTPTGPPPTEAVQEAVADLVGLLGIGASDIEVVLDEEVTWRDGSIGCAEPGKMYTQAVVAGRRVVLSARGMQYEYHSGGPRGLFHCEKPTE